MQNQLVPHQASPTILQLIPALETGGAERGTVDMAIAIKAAGGQPLVISAGGKLAAELDQAGIEHQVWPSIKSKNPFKIRTNAKKLEALLKERRVDLVHARSRAPAWSGYWAAKATGVPYMTTFHAAYNFGNKLKRWYNSVMAKGARVIAISSFIRQHIIDNYPTDPAVIRLIHRGIDVNKFDPLAVDSSRLAALRQAWNVPDGAPILLLAGRLTRWKGQRVLIEAMAYLKDLSVVAVCVGDDQGRTAYRQELETLIKELGLTDKVRLPGDCRDMPAANALASLVLSCSIEPEAFGRVIIEAQAMGKPVIVSQIGAVAETVEAGGCGWTVPPGNAGALAAAIRFALNLPPAEHQLLSHQARAFVVANYTKEQMAAKTLAVYNELLPANKQLQLPS